MHCRRTATGGATGFDYACYVTNYGNINTDDATTLKNARTNLGRRHRNHGVLTDKGRGALTDRQVKFYVYNAAGTRVNNADLDGLGRRPVPQLCMVCHGGAYPSGGTTGVPGFTASTVKLGSRFIPFDLRFLTFPASPNKAAQQAAMKRLNEDIVRNAPALPAPDAVADVVTAMYAGGVATQREEFVVPGWAQAQLPNTAAQEDFYKRVVGNACRTCHMTQVFANMSSARLGVDLQFRTARDFLRSQPITGGGNFSPFSFAEQRVCVDHVMPHAKRTHDIFWGQYWQNDFGAILPTITARFQAFGDTIKALPRPPAWPAAEAWPPAWNGDKCGSFVGAGTTPPSYYSTFTHPLWSRAYGTQASNKCTSCHSDLSGNATDTRAKLLAGFFGGGSPEVIAGNAAGASRAAAPGTTGCSDAARVRARRRPRCLNRRAASDGNGRTCKRLTTEIDRVIFWISQTLCLVLHARRRLSRMNGRYAISAFETLPGRGAPSLRPRGRHDRRPSRRTCGGPVHPRRPRGYGSRAQPSPAPMWLSPDIWVRNSPLAGWNRSPPSRARRPGWFPPRRTRTPITAARSRASPTTSTCGSETRARRRRRPAPSDCNSTGPPPRRA